MERENMKRRRKLFRKNGGNKRERFVMDKFLKELSGYDNYLSEGGSRENLTISDLGKLLKMENESKLELLLASYFGNVVEAQEHCSEIHREPVVLVDTNKDDLVFALLECLSREVEKENVANLHPSDTAFFELCGNIVHRDMVMEIISFLSFNYELIKSVGCLNSSFYLLILSNWKSKVELYSHEHLRQISLLVLRSLRHLSIYITGDLEVEDYEYIFDNITHEQVLSFEIGVGNNVEEKDVLALFEVGYRKKIVFHNCKVFRLGETVKRRLLMNWNGTPSVVSDKNSHLFSSLLPNIESLQNPFHVKRCFTTKDCFKKFKKVKHLIFAPTITHSEITVLSYTNSFLSHLSNVCHSHEQLEHLEMKKGCTDLCFCLVFEKLPLFNLTNLSISFDDIYLPNNGCSWTANVSKILCKLKHLDKLCIQLKSCHTIDLEGNRSFYKNLKKDFLVNSFPSTLTELKLKNPPLPIIELISQKFVDLKNLKNLEILWEADNTGSMCSSMFFKEGGSPGKVFRNNVFFGFLDYLLQNETIEKFRLIFKLKASGIYEYEQRMYGSTIALIYSRRIKKLMYIELPIEQREYTNTNFKRKMNEKNLKRFNNIVKKNVNIVSLDEEEKYNEKGEDGKMTITSFYVCFYPQKSQEEWNELTINRVLPEGKEVVCENEGIVTEKLYDFSGDESESWKIEYEKRRFYVV